MSAVLKGVHPVARPMREPDLPAVLAIERKSYEFPWTMGIFADCLRIGYCCWVGEVAGVVSAYGIMAVAAGESHILNICVDRRSRRRGIGRMMLERLLGIAVEHYAQAAYLEVRPSNVAAMSMYREFGFEQVGIRRDYYPALRGREDALVLAKRLSGTEGS